MSKTDQPELDIKARALFDAMPHNHPGGQAPDWNIQPEHNKDVFRHKVIK